MILDLAGVGIFLVSNETKKKKPILGYFTKLFANQFFSCKKNLGPDPSMAKIKMMYNTEIIGFLIVGCCDFIAQSILVRTS